MGVVACRRLAFVSVNEKEVTKMKKFSFGFTDSFWGLVLPRQVLKDG